MRPNLAKAFELAYSMCAEGLKSLMPKYFGCASVLIVLPSIRMAQIEISSQLTEQRLFGCQFELQCGKRLAYLGAAAPALSFESFFFFRVNSMIVYKCVELLNGT